MAAATLLPPFRPRLMMQGTPDRRISSLAGTTFTKPTGTPMISSGRQPVFSMISCRDTSAVGAFPTATIRGLVSFDARSMLTVARVTPRALASAATSGSADVTGYAITIVKALSVVEQITSGQDTADITLGTPAFLGVQLSDSTADGAAVLGADAGFGSSESSDSLPIWPFIGMAVAAAALIVVLVAKRKKGDEE